MSSPCKNFVFFDTHLVQAVVKHTAASINNQCLAFYGACLITTPQKQERIGLLTAIYNEKKEIVPITIASHRLFPTANEPANWSDELQTHIKELCIRSQINNINPMNSSFIFRLQQELTRLNAQSIIIPSGLTFSANL